MKTYSLKYILILVLFVSCNSEYTVKKKGYYKIDFPEHEYQKFDRPGYPFTFEYPVYAAVIRDSTFFEDATENPYWVNIDFPRFAGKIYISYKEIGKKNSFDKLVNDAFNMTFKHTPRATGIRDSLMRTDAGLTGVFFSVGGNTATAKQFFITDSTRHFIRGALYFDATPNEDSLMVVNRFLQEDMKHLINTLRWR
jgi:gliding motility-associated lipoprotein GldD